jgi:hypothetical protein
MQRQTPARRAAKARSPPTSRPRPVLPRRKLRATLGPYVAAVEAYYETCAAQQRAFVEAGRANSSWSAEARAYSIEAALVWQLRQAELPQDFLRLPAISQGHLGPLAERDTAMIDVASDEE